GAGDLLLRVAQQLGPLGQPTDRARDGEQHREHRRGQLHGLVDDARVEIDVRVELARDEILILQRYPLQLDGDVDQRVAAGHLEDLVSQLFDDLAARVEIFIYSVPKAHQLALAALDARNKRRELLGAADLG